MVIGRKGGQRTRQSTVVFSHVPRSLEETMYLLCMPPLLVCLALNVRYTSEIAQKFQVTFPWFALFKEMARYLYYKHTFSCSSLIVLSEWTNNFFVFQFTDFWDEVSLRSTQDGVQDYQARVQNRTCWNHELQIGKHHGLQEGTRWRRHFRSQIPPRSGHQVISFLFSLCKN